MQDKRSNRQMLKIILWGKPLGMLSWNNETKSSFFWFSPEYFRENYDIAPLVAPKSRQSSAIAIRGNKNTKMYHGLPPFIADSLPDAWGNAIFDRWFTEQKLRESEKTPLTKLAFIGKRALGALEFEPCMDWEQDSENKLIIEKLYAQAKLFEEQLQNAVINTSGQLTTKELRTLGTSAGGRMMKIIASMDKDGNLHSGKTNVNPDFKHYIIKFNNPEHSFAEMEMTYHLMALEAGLNMMPSRYITADGIRHFATERFDRKDGRKAFVQTLAAINPEAHTYEDLFSTCRELGMPARQMEDLYRQAVFNHLTNNTDDHEKNFSFIMSEEGEWKLSPAYDITFIMNRYGNAPETAHCMSLAGKFEGVTDEELIRFGIMQDIRNPKYIIAQIKDSISKFEIFAGRCGLDGFHKEIISKRLVQLNPEIESSFSLFPKYRFLSETHGNISDIFFEKSDSGNIHLFATIEGRRMRKVITDKQDIYKTILESGFNNMPDKQKETIIEKLFFDNKKKRPHHI